jgi:hypothetical protein
MRVKHGVWCNRHPGLGPGSMNTVGGELPLSVFMDSGCRRNDGATGSITVKIRLSC